MKGTITWLEATEENVREIPRKEGTEESKKLRIKYKYRNSSTSYNGYSHYSFSANNFFAEIEYTAVIVTHFAYINEPE